MPISKRSAAVPLVSGPCSFPELRIACCKSNGSMPKLRGHRISCGASAHFDVALICESAPATWRLLAVISTRGLALFFVRLLRESHPGRRRRWRPPAAANFAGIQPAMASCRLPAAIRAAVLSPCLPHAAEQAAGQGSGSLSRSTSPSTLGYGVASLRSINPSMHHSGCGDSWAREHPLGR